MKKVTVTIGLFAFAILAISFSSTTKAAGAAPAGDPVKGKAVYTAQKCSMCHAIAGTGSKIGPDLSAEGTKRDAAWLTKYLQAPTPIDPKNPPKMKMTPVKVKGQDLDDLVAYMLSLKGK